MNTDKRPPPLEPLSQLQDTLNLLLEHIQAYERALPSGNHSARAALGGARRLADQAIREADSLQDALEPTGKSPEHPFTPREHEVLSHAARGLTNKEIAYRLGISERTVQFHMNSIFNKTAANSRTEAVVMALEQGWLQSS